MKLVDYPSIPIHLKVKEDEEIKLESSDYYTVELGEFVPSMKSIEVIEIKHFGKIGSAKPEITLFD